MVFMFFLSVVTILYSIEENKVYLASKSAKDNLETMKAAMEALNTIKQMESPEKTKR
jgi:hypothetical protein